MICTIILLGPAYKYLQSNLLPPVCKTEISFILWQTLWSATDSKILPQRFLYNWYVSQDLFKSFRSTGFHLQKENIAFLLATDFLRKNTIQWQSILDSAYENLLFNKICSRILCQISCRQNWMFLSQKHKVADAVRIGFMRTEKFPHFVNDSMFVLALCQAKKRIVHMEHLVFEA